MGVGEIGVLTQDKIFVSKYHAGNTILSFLKKNSM